jgi:hypothetical protein
MLSKADKIRLVKSLPISDQNHLRSMILMSMGGSGKKLDSLKNFLVGVKDTLKPVVKVVGLTVLKEVLVPALKAKMGMTGDGKKKRGRPKGSGLKTAGQGLRLAGKGCGKCKY